MTPDTSAAVRTLPTGAEPSTGQYPPWVYILAIDGRRDPDDPGRAEERRPHGVRGLVGAGPGLRDLGRGPGLGSARAHPVRDGGIRRGAAREGDRAWRRILLLLLRGDRHRPVAVREGRVGDDHAGLPVRFDEPRVG